MLYIKTPGTTANMGPGFDCIGMALQIYNHLWVSETEEDLYIETKREQQFPVPKNKSNLIYRTIRQFYQETGKKMPGLHMVQEDYIPMTRGLGSSAACIVSGLLAANTLSGANYDKDTLVQIAAKIEGHPDNAAPALLGGMVVGAIGENGTKYVKVPVADEIQFGVMIPNFQLSTEAARKVLPKSISIQDSVFNTSRAALLIASFFNGQWDNLDIAMDDCLHQPYRKTLIRGMDEIFAFARKNGAKGVFLSGAGPTLIAVYLKNSAFSDKMAAYLKTLPDQWSFQPLAPDLKGAIVQETSDMSCF